MPLQAKGHPGVPGPREAAPGSDRPLSPGLGGTQPGRLPDGALQRLRGYRCLLREVPRWWHFVTAAPGHWHRPRRPVARPHRVWSAVHRRVGLASSDVNLSPTGSTVRVSCGGRPLGGSRRALAARDGAGAPPPGWGLLTPLLRFNPYLFHVDLLQGPGTQDPKAPPLHDKKGASSSVPEGGGPGRGRISSGTPPPRPPGL